MKMIFFVWIVLVMLSACDNREKDNNMFIDSLTARSKCVGRNLIKIPIFMADSPITTGTFRNAGSGSQAPSFEVIVNEAGWTRPQFFEAIQKRRAELLSTSSETVDVLKLEKTVNDDTVLFRVQRIDDAYMSELNLLRGGNLVTITLNSYDDKFALAEAALLKFSKAIHFPTESDPDGQANGFCLGPVSVDGDFEHENASFLFGDPKRLSLSVEIETFNPDESVPLLDRMSGPASLLRVFDVRHGVIRSGERQTSGMRAQEWLGWAKVSEESSSKSLKFILETLRPIPGRTKPSINVTLNAQLATEEGRGSSATEDELTQMWDFIVNSLKPRKV